MSNKSQSAATDRSPEIALLRRWSWVRAPALSPTYKHLKTTDPVLIRFRKPVILECFTEFFERVPLPLGRPSTDGTVAF